eukprot:EG_transcript_15226
MFLSRRFLALGTCAGLACAARSLLDREERAFLWAKSTPLGAPLQNVIVKGYGCHPRTVKVTTILLYYNIPFQTKEFNSLTNDNVYNNIPVVRFEHAEFDWWQSRGDDEAMQQLSLVCLNRQMTKPEQEWHEFITHKLTPALEYRMWRTWSSTLENMQYFSGVKSTSWFRRLVHPYTAALILPFRKNRQLRKIQNVNKSSFSVFFQETLAHMDGMKGSFIGGKRPNISDLELFGVLSAVRQTTLEQEILQGATPRFKEWYGLMRQEVYGDNQAAWQNKTHFALEGVEGLGFWRF